MSNSLIATVEVLQQAVAKGLPQSVADAARTSSYDAFLSASHITTLVSASLVAVACLVVYFMLPPITPPKKGARAHGAPPAPAVEGHADVLKAHTSEQAAASADELEDSYATEAAEEYAAREGKHDQS